MSNPGSSSCSSPTSGLDRQNPWPGLRSFSFADTQFFRGRASKVDELFDLVTQGTLTVFYGQSGLGKTSLLQAGVVPRLRKADFLPVLVRLDHSPDAPPLAEQVKRAVGLQLTAQTIDAPLPDPSETLWEYFHRRDVDFWDARNRRVQPVLIFDQFEEIYTRGRATAAARERSNVFRVELESLTEDHPPSSVRERIEQQPETGRRFDFEKASCRLVLSLREDFLPCLLKERRRFRGVSQRQCRLERMSGDEAWEAIMQPGGDNLVEESVALQILGILIPHRETEAASAARLETPAASRLTQLTKADLPNLEIDPALLSVICRELNLARHDLKQPQITSQIVKENEGSILDSFYETSLEGMPPRVRLFIEDRLISRSGEYRVPMPFGEATGSGEVTTEDMTALADRRLLNVEDHHGIPHVELAHDRLTEVVLKSRDKRRQREALELEAQRRQEMRRRLRRLQLASAGFVLLALLACWLAQRAWQQERVATQAQTGAQRLSRFMLDDLCARLKATGKLKLMASVATNAQQYYMGLPLAALPASSLKNQAAVFQRIGEVRADQGLLKQSLEAYANGRELIHQWQRGDSGDEPLSELAMNYAQSGKVLAMEGKRREAFLCLNQSQAVYQQLVKRHPQEANYQRGLAELQRNRGKLFSTGGARQQAKDCYEESLGILDRVQSKPDDTEALFQLAQTLSALQGLDTSQGARTEAYGALERSLHLLETLHAREPDNVLWESEIVSCLVSRADHCRSSGKRIEARKLFEKALETCRKLVILVPDDPSRQMELAVAGSRVGEITGETGKNKEQIDLWRQTMAAVEKVLAKAPEMIVWRRDRGQCQINLASYLRNDDLEAATKYAQLGLESAEELAKRDPENVNWQLIVANANQVLGDCLVDSGDSEQAEELYQKALEITQRLSQLDPQWLRPRGTTAETWKRRASLCQTKGDYDLAVKTLNVCIELQQSLVGIDPEDVNRLSVLSFYLNELGTCLYQQEKYNEAIVAYQKSTAVDQKLIAGHPDYMAPMNSLAVTWAEIGNAYKAAEKFDEALAAYQQGIENRKKFAAHEPEDPQWQKQLAAAYEDLGGYLKDRDQAEAAANARAQALAARTNELALCMRRREKEPANVAWWQDLVSAYEDLATFHASQSVGDSKESARHWQLALDARIKEIELLKGRAEQEPGNLDALRELARAYENLASAHNRLDETNQTAAAAAYRNAIDVWKVRADKATEKAESLSKAAETCAKYAKALKARAKPEDLTLIRKEELVLRQQVIDLLQNESEQQTNGVSPLRTLIKSLEGIVETYDQLDQPEHVIKSHDRIVQLWKAVCEREPGKAERLTKAALACEKFAAWSAVESKPAELMQLQEQELGFRQRLIALLQKRAEQQTNSMSSVRALCRSLEDILDTYERLNRQEQVLETHKRIVNLWKAVGEKEPGNAEGLTRAALACEEHAGRLAVRRKPAEWARMQEEELAFRQQLVARLQQQADQQTNSASSLRALTGSLEDILDTYLRLDRQDKVLETRERITGLQKLVSTDSKEQEKVPRDPELRNGIYFLTDVTPQKNMIVFGSKEPLRIKALCFFLTWRYQKLLTRDYFGALYGEMFRAFQDHADGKRSDLQNVPGLSSGIFFGDREYKFKQTFFVEGMVPVEMRKANVAVAVGLTVRRVEGPAGNIVRNRENLKKAYKELKTIFDQEIDYMAQNPIFLPQ